MPTTREREFHNYVHFITTKIMHLFGMHALEKAKRTMQWNLDNVFTVLETNVLFTAVKMPTLRKIKLLSSIMTTIQYGIDPVLKSIYQFIADICTASFNSMAGCIMIKCLPFLLNASLQSRQFHNIVNR